MILCFLNVQGVKMLIAVLITFVITWLPSMLMEIIRYNHVAQPKGNVNYSWLCEVNEDEMHQKVK